ncbi:MAG: hypothetical protein GYB64_11660, partial [Chloroflexi bacterium]|nr:hypothetical protein [Chloroflexota bacterium]
MTRRDTLTAAAVGLLLLAIYLSTTPLRLRSIDEAAVFCVSRSLAGHGGVDCDSLVWRAVVVGTPPLLKEGLDGRYYAVKDVTPSLLGAPLVWAAYQLELSPIRTMLLLTPVATALTGAGLVLAIRGAGWPLKTAIAGALAFGVGTAAWPYAETLFPQGGGGLGLLVAVGGALAARRTLDWRAALVCGLGLSLAASSVGGLWAVGPVLLAYLVLGVDRRRMVPLMFAFGVGAAVAFVGISAFNLARFGGSPLTAFFSHQTGATSRMRLLHTGTGLIGQLFSTPRGLLWYTPLIVLVPFGLAKWPRREAVFFGALIAALLVFYSFYDEWWGGLAFGPRFAVPLMSIIALSSVPVLDDLVHGRLRPAVRSAVVGVLVLAFVSALLPSLFYTLGESELTIAENFIRITPPERFAQLDPFLFEPRWLPQIRLVGAGLRGEWDVLWMARGSPDWLLLAAHAILIGTGALALRYAAQHPRWAIGQGVLTVLVIALMVGRYPEASRTFGPTLEPINPATMDALAAHIDQQTTPGDAVITALPFSTL